MDRLQSEEGLTDAQIDQVEDFWETHANDENAFSLLNDFVISLIEGTDSDDSPPLQDPEEAYEKQDTTGHRLPLQDPEEAYEKQDTTGHRPRRVVFSTGTPGVNRSGGSQTKDNLPNEGLKSSIIRARAANHKQDFKREGVAPQSQAFTPIRQTGVMSSILGGVGNAQAKAPVVSGRTRPTPQLPARTPRGETHVGQKFASFQSERAGNVLSGKRERPVAGLAASAAPVNSLKQHIAQVRAA